MDKYHVSPNRDLLQEHLDAVEFDGGYGRWNKTALVRLLRQHERTLRHYEKQLGYSSDSSHSSVSSGPFDSQDGAMDGDAADLLRERDFMQSDGGLADRYERDDSDALAFLWLAALFRNSPEQIAELTGISEQSAKDLLCMTMVCGFMWMNCPDE